MGTSLSPWLEASPAVAACLAGHDHPGGYGKTLMRGRGADGRMWGRVHHVTLEAMLEVGASTRPLSGST
jgi:hypothetical protein